MAEKVQCCGLREAIEHLIREKSYVSGMVISASPDKYVMVRDLRAVLKATAKDEEKPCLCGGSPRDPSTFHKNPDCPYFDYAT